MSTSTMQLDTRIGRRIKLRELHIALAVAQAGSMLGAAKVLAISQPVVSKAISNLEQTLGTRLFDRSRKGVEPTASGRALISHSRAALEELRQGLQEVKLLNDPTAGELRIGCSRVLAEGLVPTVVGRLSRQYPRIVFHIVETDTLAIYEELREGRIDVGFARISDAVTSEDRLQCEELFEEPLVVVAGARSHWTRRRKVTLDELLNETWTWPSPGNIVNSLATEAFRVSGFAVPQVAVYADSFAVRAKLAATGQFLSIVAASTLRFSAGNASIKTVAVKVATKTSPRVGAITLKNRTLNPLVELVVKSAREVAKSHGASA